MRGRIAAVMVAAGASMALALEPTVELPAGGLLFAAHDTITVDNELLTIGLDRIEINYRLRSTAATPRVVPMAFPLPTIDKGALGTAEVVLPAFDSRNPTNFVGFWTTFDGVPVEPEDTATKSQLSSRPPRHSRASGWRWM